MHSVDRDEQHVLDLVTVKMTAVRPVVAMARGHGRPANRHRAGRQRRKRRLPEMSPHAHHSLLGLVGYMGGGRCGGCRHVNEGTPRRLAADETILIDETGPVDHRAPVTLRPGQRPAMLSVTITIRRTNTT